MIPRLYKAAMDGQTEILNQYINQFEVELTANNNTVLHIAAQFGQLDCVKIILEKCPALLHKENRKRETPLHLAAARKGNLGVVEAIINHPKLEAGGQTAQLLSATNLDEDTALHMAVRNGHLEIVRFLTSEDRLHPYPANKAKETPLYLAVERNNHEMVVAILENCGLRDYSGPDGRTALHEAVLIDKHPEMARRLLQWKPELIDKKDTSGWIPLHYAALSGNVGRVKEILEMNYLLALSTTGDEDDGKTALHIAAAAGHVEVMEEILSACPECWEIVDRREDNILHNAAQFGQDLVIRFILQKAWSEELINQKNNEGNTPLHLLAASDEVILKQPWTRHKYQSYNGYWNSFNDKNQSPAAVALSQDLVAGTDLVAGNIGSIAFADEHGKLRKLGRARKEEQEKERNQQKKLEKAREAYSLESEKRGKSHMIVASLVATITFAASFTIPGGYDLNSGTATLVKEAAFKTFIITNTIAVLLSILSVYYFVSTHFIRDKGRRNTRILWAIVWLQFAIMATTIAFITGTYSMLPHSSGIAIACCVIGCSFLCIYVVDMRIVWILLGGLTFISIERLA